jgi:hypothetical protein
MDVHTSVQGVEQVIWVCVSLTVTNPMVPKYGDPTSPLKSTSYSVEASLERVPGPIRRFTMSARSPTPWRPKIGGPNGRINPYT